MPFKLDLDVPRTDEQVVTLRKKMLVFAEKHFGPIEKFTCDDCGLVKTCTLAFDSYNVGGDCLAEK